MQVDKNPDNKINYFLVKTKIVLPNKRIQRMCKEVTTIELINENNECAKRNDNN